MQRLLTLAEAGELLGYGIDKMYRLARSDKSFPSIKIGGQYRISEDKLEAYINDMYYQKEV